MSGIGLISNPYSKKNRRNPERLNYFRDILPDKSLAKFPTTFDEMDAAIHAFKNQNIDVVAVNGGDGTLHVAITRMIKIYGEKPLPKIAVLKGGTMNMVGTNCRIKGNTEGILKNVCEKYTHKKEFRIIQRPILNIQGNYGFIFGNGIVCNFMDVYHKNGNPSPYIALKSLVTSALSIMTRGEIYRRLFKPMTAEIISDTFSFGRKPYLGIFVTTVPEIGLGFELMHRARNRTDVLHCLALHDKISIVPQLGRVYLGRSLPPHTADDTISKNLCIRADKPFKYTIDGDFYNTTGELIIKTDKVIDIIAG